MTYVTGFLTPVKSEDKARYVKSAQVAWPLFQKYGALSQVETWGEDVPEGKLTDFRRAVALKDGETVAVGWITWPDKATRDAAWAVLMDPNGPMGGMDMPFDGKRMIFGAFDTIAES